MNSSIDSSSALLARPLPTSWGAILTLTATSFLLSTGEFLPPSLLPAMASSLHVTQGQAGQAVTATAFAGLVMAPLIGVLFPRVERRTLLSLLAVSATVSNVAVAFSGNLVLLLIARLLLGAAIGGFWALSLAVAARLSQPHHLGRSLTLVNMGATLATVAGVPTGIWLGSIFDWRVVFVVIGALTLTVAVTLRTVLPTVPPEKAAGLGALRRTLLAPGLAWGLAGHTLTMLGNFAAFTYIRPALALTPELRGNGSALLILIFGLGAVAGGFVTGALVDKHQKLLRTMQPILLGASVASLSLFSGHTWVIVVAVVVWGAVFGGWLIVVSAWIGSVIPSQMETGGGLMVAGYQLAITLGAGLGGLIVDESGIRSALLLAALAALFGGVLLGTARSHLGPASAKS